MKLFEEPFWILEDREIPHIFRASMAPAGTLPTFRASSCRGGLEGEPFPCEVAFFKKGIKMYQSAINFLTSCNPIFYILKGSLLPEVFSGEFESPQEVRQKHFK